MVSNQLLQALKNPKNQNLNERVTIEKYGDENRW